ncbi:Putative protein kinase-like domain superfamily, fructosamine/Ketosamine-3-kinase [Septoria linicola]|uniref:protein-ribulosamine 3-kinase n=1 Tax=Septoria linicola TaxID=215465 RepID=A0A9Q9AP16_9PEZI|nr:putative protein kinase-like domain superfamily, fructosamine/Ketosamine-3-kinase [Septoria linicola]USW50513.1 Putative protein kinase-like domain superfamily, fructosamine/Ketosamine-3-kinase [Septoria linicola]
MAPVDSAILSLLNLEADQVTASGHGGSSFSSTSKITAKQDDGTSKSFFMKSGKGSDSKIMFEGEHASLNAIHNAVPTLCPQSYGAGTFSDSKDTYFLVTDFLDLSARGSASGQSLAQKIAKLHTTPAPVPEGYDKPQFGFPVTTCCGATPQDNSYSSSWADFYANKRIRGINKQSRKQNGPDKELDTLTEQLCEQVIPRLIGDSHLNNGKSVTPVVVHGDLWSGNASTGKLPGMSDPEAVVYDSSACYAHSEFELGIMKMFGGFGGAFLKEYHELVPKIEPVDEYEDRIKLYELYHHLNHHALFGGGYKSGAVSMMKDLIRNHGGKSEL